MLSQAVRLSFSKLFNFKPFREKAIFHLRQYYFSELDFSVRLGQGFDCPISDVSASYSFTEIFFENEYKPVFDLIDLPSRWLDLGCHYGYFSLYVAWLRAKQDLPQNFRGLLVDADSRVLHGVSTLIQRNHLEAQLSFRHGAISSGSGSVYFQESDVMSSSLSDLLPNTTLATTSSVPIIDQQVIESLLPPPYDLVKIDVEGGEYDFFLSYERILQNTSHMVLEWHSWHRGGGSLSQILDLAKSYDFELLQEIQPAKLCGDPATPCEVGVLLFKRSAA